MRKRDPSIELYAIERVLDVSWYSSKVIFIKYFAIFIINSTTVKYIRVFLIFILGISIQNVSAQNENVLKINVAGSILKSPEISYEMLVSNKTSVTFGFLYTWYSPSETKVNGWSFTPEFRFYIGSAGAPRGFFTAPFVKYQNFNVESLSNDKGKFTSIGAGLQGGYQWFLTSWLTLDGFFGIGYNIGSLNTDGPSYDFEMDYYDGMIFRFGVNLGVSF